MKENIEIHTAAGTTELVIREGAALELLNPEIVNITGTIDAPTRFIINRKVEIQPHKECNIRVNLDLGKIILVVAEKNPFGSVIEGVLTVNKDITDFGINNGRYLIPEDLAAFLRMRKHLFHSTDNYMSVFTALRTFTAKVNQEIKAIRTDTGDYETKKAQVVEHNIPKVFTLELPIFKGMSKVVVAVEILVNKNLEVTLYSSDLIQSQEELREQYLNDQVNTIMEVAPDIVIINV